MKKRVFFSFISIIFLFTDLSSYSQKLLYPEKQWPLQWFQRFVVFEGKAGSCITSILEDRKGFIWIGKESSLYRFDGSGYLSFPAGNNDTSLYGAVVLSIYEDSDGIIWAGTYSALNRVDIKTGKVKHFFPDTSDLSSDNNSIVSIHEDQTGKLWLQTKKDLFTFNRKTEIFTVYHVDSLAWNSSQENVNLVSERFCQDSRGRIWAGTNNGLYCLEGEVWKKVWPEGENSGKPGGNHIYCVEEDKEGNIWFGTHENGVIRIDVSDRITKIEFPFTKGNINDRRVSAIYSDSTGRIWVSCHKVISEYDTNGRLLDSWQMCIPADARRNSNAELFVNRIFPGENNSLWLIWISQGIIINFSPGSGEFTINGVPNWIDFNCIQDRHGNIWAGAIYSSLYCLFTDSVPYRKNFVPHATGPECYNRSRLAEDRKGHLWIVCRSGEIIRIESPSSSSIPAAGTEIFHLPYSDIRPLSIFCDQDGIIWFGCSKNTLISYDPLKEKFYRYESPPGNPNGIEIITGDRLGNLWLVNPYSEIFVLRSGSSSIEKFISLSELPGYERNSNFWDLLVDHSRNLWFSSNFGIFRTDCDRLRLYDLRGTDGTGSKYANWYLRIIEDGNNNIWALNSLKGPCRFDFGKGVFETAGFTDDLTGLYFHNFITDYKDRLWVFHNNLLRILNTTTGDYRDITFNKLNLDLNCMRLTTGEIVILNGQDNMIFPREIPLNRNVPPVYITELLVNNILYNRLFPDEEPVSDLRNIDLGFRQNNLSLRFASLNYRQPEMNRYRYFMKGMDRDTVETGSRGAEYINMQPGKYKFWVTGSNNDGIWNPDGVTLDVWIHPPFYRSALAYVIYILAIAALILVYIRVRISRLLKEKMRLEVEVSQRTSELRIKNLQLEEADRTKTRFFTNISHEIRTPLSLILGPIDNLIKEHGDDEKEGRLFEVMKRNGQRLLQMVNQLLDISRLDSGKMKIILSETDIIKDLRILVYEFLSLAETKNIRYVVEISDKEYITFADIDKTEKIISNLLSNAFKFTREGGCVCCNILIRQSDSTQKRDILEIQVKDTGPGIAPENIEKIFDRFYRVEDHYEKDITGTGIGLSLTREFVSLLHGDIKVQSTPGEGTEFIITIPLGRVHLSDDEYIIAELHDLERMKPHLLHDIVKAEKITSAAEKQEKVTILVVEDNIDLRNFMAESMAQDYRIVEAEDGKEGANLALTIIPDLVVTDLMMPGMDGVSLCRLMKNDERTSHIPIIMLTARATAEEKIEGLMAGADDYIIKPFNIEELKVRITNLLGQREKLKQKYSNHFAFRPGDREPVSADDLFLRKIYNIIRENLKDFDFDAGALHEKAGMSRVHLFRKLKAITGLSPGTLIRNIRLETAAVYLAGHSGNITEISNSVGISNPSYFTKCFKKYFKVSPREYAAARNLEN